MYVYTHYTHDLPGFIYFRLQPCSADLPIGSPKFWPGAWATGSLRDASIAWGALPAILSLFLRREPQERSPGLKKSGTLLRDFPGERFRSWIQSSSVSTK